MCAMAKQYSRGEKGKYTVGKVVNMNPLPCMEKSQSHFKFTLDFKKIFSHILCFYFSNTSPVNDPEN